MYRSSSPEVFCKKGVLIEISQSSQENTGARNLFSIKLQIKKETLVQVFSHRTPLVAACVCKFISFWLKIAIIIIKIIVIIIITLFIVDFQVWLLQCKVIIIIKCKSIFPINLLIFTSLTVYLASLFYLFESHCSHYTFYCRTNNWIKSERTRW